MSSETSISSWEPLSFWGLIRSVNRVVDFTLSGHVAIGYVGTDQAFWLIEGRSRPRTDQAAWQRDVSCRSRAVPARDGVVIEPPTFYFRPGGNPVPATRLTPTGLCRLLLA
jgi:hypothetical protein